MIKRGRDMTGREIGKRKEEETKEGRDRKGRRKVKGKKREKRVAC